MSKMRYFISFLFVRKQSSPQAVSLKKPGIQILLIVTLPSVNQFFDP